MGLQPNFFLRSLGMLLAAAVAAVATTPVLPVEVYMKGENITGFNPANDTRAYYCFRIPQLLALPSGTILAFAEGRADGCRPDGRTNRPIVVRASKNQGKTWGPIGIAGPALPHSGTNYPGGYLRWAGGAWTVAMRYDTSGGVLEVVSSDEGTTWSAPINASQPAGGAVKCGSAWPKMLGTDVVISCSAGHTATSTDGGLSWKPSTTPVSLNTSGTGVTGLGESMVVADGRTNRSLTMMIRAGSKNSWLNHAIAQSEDGGDNWGVARLLPIVGTTCEGSIGRDTKAAPGAVLLAATFGRNKFRLGRGNMSVFSLDTGNTTAEPVSTLDVWPQAAGYSDFTQVRTAQGKMGPVLLLFEGGGSVYDYGIKISPVG
jgi:hypothetical protein